MSAGLLSAQTIYDDSFARGTPAAPAVLDGTSPNVVNTNGSTWAGGGNNFTTNGLNASSSPAVAFEPEQLAFTSSFLPSSPTGTLTLSATLTATVPANGDNSDWTSLGFFSSRGAFFPTNSSGDYTMLLTAGGGFDVFTTSTNGEQVLVNGMAGMDSTTATISEQLNFSTRMATYFVGVPGVPGVQVGTGPFDPVAFLSSVQYVGFSGYSDNTTSETATVANFVVSYSVPEPSAYALLGLGFAALIVVARARRSAAL